MNLVNQPLSMGILTSSPRVGFVGWRGMVGSVLVQRMKEEGDFSKITPVVFSTSQVGQQIPDWAFRTNSGGQDDKMYDAYSIDSLSSCDAIVSCQGSDYTKEIHPKLRASGWDGFWIDAASALRTSAESVLILDPVNLSVIERAMSFGIKDFIGANCTVSLMLMALNGLFQRDLVEVVNSMTYQSASGAGAAHMRELIKQMGSIHKSAQDDLSTESNILELDRKVRETLDSETFPKTHFGFPLAANLLPWIDNDLGNGTSREEWKGGVEANKILGKPAQGQNGSVSIDGLCVRVGVMRCHSQALSVRLKESLTESQVESLISNGTAWSKLVPNQKQISLELLTPSNASGTLNIYTGRVKKTSYDQFLFNMFTVGDQLLWGAAEPLRRMLRILL